MVTPKDRQLGSATSSARERYPEHNDSADENTSLLNPSTPAVANEQHEAVDERMPWVQILLLSYARITESIAFWSIFPYISQMIQDNGNVPDSDIGFYSGIVEATLALTQTFTSYPWGRTADRIGRKPCMVISLTGVTFATALFGMTKTIPQMILLRFITGIFTGTMVTIRTMFADLSAGKTKKTKGRIQSYFAFSGSLGILIGPVLGGSLANPASQFPTIFGGVAFFEKYPYALSSLAVAFGGATSALLNLFYLKETLRKAPAGNSENGDASNASKSKDSMRTWQLLESKTVRLALGVYGLVMALNFAYSAIVPVSLYTPVRLGGYGWAPHRISLLMGLNGAAQTVWMMVVSPWLHGRIGPKGVMRLCSIIYPLYYLSFPIGNFFLRQETRSYTTVFWIFLPLAVVLGSGSNMALIACNVALNDSSPEHLRGTLSGIALTENGILKTLSPVLFSTLFALGARTQFLGGYAIWGVFVALTSCFAYAVKHLPDN